MNGFDGEWPYPSTDTNQPVARGGPEIRANWLESRKHASALNQELQERFDRSEDQASWEVIQRIDPGSIEFPGSDLTPRPPARPVQYRIPGAPVRAFRAYSVGEKGDRATYNHTENPPWFP